MDVDPAKLEDLARRLQAIEEKLGAICEKIQKILHDTSDLRSSDAIRQARDGWPYGGPFRS